MQKAFVEIGLCACVCVYVCMCVCVCVCAYRLFKELGDVGHDRIGAVTDTVLNHF